MKKVILLVGALTAVSMVFGQNVGVGTNSPQYKLHVTGGDIFLQSSSGRLIIGYDGSNQWRYATTGGGADLLMSSFDGTTNNYRHYFRDNGYLGLGTGATAPDAPLHIKSTSSLIVKAEGNSPYMALYDNTDGYRAYWWYNGTDVIFGSGTGSGAKLSIAPNGSISTAFHPDGRVSMGNITPATGYQLSVRGKIIAEELKVQLNGSWPDYVFHKNYKLMPLQQLENIIMAQQHLPNIPSAAQVEKEGFSVGDMNKRLLEKVEELTLYMIELNKKNSQLEMDIKQLQAQMAALKK